MRRRLSINRKSFSCQKKNSFKLERKFLLIRKSFLFRRKLSFWQVKLFLFIDNRLLTLQIPDYQQAYFWACISERISERLLIIRNLQSEKTIVNNRKEFYLSKGKFLQIRKKIPADKEIFPLQKEFSFWQVKLFLFIDKCLLTLQIPDYQQAFFWACNIY